QGAPAPAVAPLGPTDLHPSCQLSTALFPARANPHLLPASSRAAFHPPLEQGRACRHGWERTRRRWSAPVEPVEPHTAHTEDEHDGDQEDEKATRHPRCPGQSCRGLCHRSILTRAEPGTMNGWPCRASP